eukprot:403376966
MFLKYINKPSLQNGRFFSAQSASQQTNNVTISAQQLHQLILNQAISPSVTIFNATLKRADLNPREDHIKARIPSSIMYDFERLADQSQSAPYMLPTDEQFSKEMEKMDARKSDTFIVYDKSGMLSAPRAYWMLKSYGVSNVKILDGTFNRWVQEGFGVEQGETENAFKRVRQSKPKADDFDFKIDQNRFLKFEEVLKIKEINQQKTQSERVPFLDSRFTKNYDDGHIPTSATYPFTEVLNADRSFKTKEELIAGFKAQGINDPTNDKVVFTCQRGITACILEAAISILGNTNAQVYDGSYEEYQRKIKNIQQ